MYLIDDVQKLAKLLLKKKKIDRVGFDLILAKLSAKNKKEKSADRAGRRQAVKNVGDGYAVSFIVELKISIPDASSQHLDEDEIYKVIAKKFDMVCKKLDPLDLDVDVVTRTIPKPYAIKHKILPLYEEAGELVVAVANPEILDVIDGLSRATGRTIKPVLSTAEDISKIIHEFFGFQSSVHKAEEQITPQTFDLGNLEQLNKIEQTEQIHSDDEHIKNAVDYLFNYAFEQRASDIHIEPKREDTIIRFRIDGILHDVYKVPRAVHQAIASRIKMLARMNIADKRRPQDGRIRIEHGENVAEIRVSSLPTAFGEKLVLRVLKQDLLLRDLESLGFFPEDLIRVERFLQKPYGMVLVTGPTGSGKTTTLYSALGFLSSREKNIVTIEDPIETIHDGFNQVAVQPAVGLTFASSLRTILRQDPDIIMIGEIRDRETASNTAQAALTGHLVLSTLHTNDTVSTITRLVDLGMEPFLINSSLVGVVAQRLVRMICPHCAVGKEVSREKLALFGVTIDDESMVLKEGKGCDQCRLTGYLGRTAVYETLEISDAIKHMIQEGKSAMSIRELAMAAGMASIQENAVRKMLSGVTTMQEVLRLGHELY